MNNKTLALLAAVGATTIYGVTHTIAKGIMPVYIKPFGFILLRVLGACFLFWFVSYWGPKEKIAAADLPRILACALLGMVLNMLMFFKGLQLSTPINSSVIITITPIIVFILSAFLINEKITRLRSLGIFLGFSGALSLALFNSEIRIDAPNITLGNILFIGNSLSYAGYLVLTKPLTAKYHPFTLMKWLFLIALIINLPITIFEFIEVQWTNLPTNVILKMSFVVIGTTFFTYLLNVYSLKYLKASTLGVFIYLQPLIAILYAVSTGADSLNTLKITAALLVFLGVYLVSKNK